MVILEGSAVAAVTLNEDAEMAAAATSRTEANPAMDGMRRLAEREFMGLQALPGSQSMVQPWWIVTPQKSYSSGCGPDESWLVLKIEDASNRRGVYRVKGQRFRIPCE